MTLVRSFYHLVFLETGSAVYLSRRAFLLLQLRPGQFHFKVSFYSILTGWRGLNVDAG